MIRKYRGKMLRSSLLRSQGLIFVRITPATSHAALSHTVATTYLGKHNKAGQAVWMGRSNEQPSGIGV